MNYFCSYSRLATRIDLLDRRTLLLPSRHFVPALHLLRSSRNRGAMLFSAIRPSLFFSHSLFVNFLQYKYARNGYSPLLSTDANTLYDWEYDMPVIETFCFLNKQRARPAGVYFT